VARRVSLPHVDALDGLRGMAVAGVLLFHGGHLTGGYLGVDLFFVLSGFLITSLLLVEGRDTEHIALGSFWARRARRLLPALGGLIVGVAVYCVVFAQPSELSRIRGDAFATVGYVANWHSIATGTDYWALFRTPSPLEHTWSLAIEEQFYLVWPLVFTGLLAWRKRRTPQAVLVVAILGAVASTLLMLVLYDKTDPSRVYYGTDTRATGILLGAALAALLVMRGPVLTRAARVGLEVAGWVGVVVLAVAWTQLDGKSDTLYQGGFLVCGLAAILVIGTVVHPQRMALGRALSLRPLCLLGIISYGLYLWHWPVDLVLDADRTRIDGWPLFFVQTAVAIGIAAVSYRWLERPIRRGALTARQWAFVTPALVATAVVVIVVGTLGTGQSDAVAVVKDRSSNGATSALGGDVGRVLIVGDSVAGTLVNGLRHQGLDVVDASFVGCKVVRGTIRINDDDLQDVDCPWATGWAGDLAREHPRVVLLESSGFELQDVRPHGASKFLVPGTPEWARYWKSEWQQAIDTLTSTGAAVVIPTIACTKPKADNGAVDISRSGFNPKRVRAANEVLEDLARENAGRMVLVDLNAYVCPSGKYTDTLHGVDPLRVDGVHYTNPGSDLVGKWLAPKLAAAARLSHASAAPTTSTTAPPG
jgi:peptidoglycan/LPS O-acetylase OafA/YrhL